MTPRKLYSSLAFAEMVTWALLLLGIALKYSGVTPVGVRIAGPIHGFTFLGFGATTLLIWMNNRWPAVRGVLGLLSTIVPFATVPFEKNTEKAGLLDGRWRFQDPAEQPNGLLDQLLAFIVRKPLLAAVIILVAVVIVFTVLLSLGSPLEALRS
ncbi:DUF3817 domain-containing protein [Corynebacterium epidermidicanis]|uniref:Integral membrane protein n=1 Tax=Corynebacterium epidermidicanis TaxID=1050174 RepID=A0A0G3GUT1_9CORY|nr:DUF3817 domain-containing protein [Corynebacterium epidermidicanis]AKK03283.1 integral membrane protein [Corynebacterium epidermidicanis]